MKDSREFGLGVLEAWHRSYGAYGIRTLPGSYIHRHCTCLCAPTDHVGYCVSHFTLVEMDRAYQYNIVQQFGKAMFSSLVDTPITVGVF
jgi:hypothetical protein